MFATIRKNQPWLLGIIVTVTIASFFLWGTNRGTNGAGSGTMALATLGGKPITPDQLETAKRGVILGVLLRTQRLPTADNEMEIRRDALRNLFLVEKAHEMGITANADAVAAFARQQILGRMSFEDFEAKLLRPAGLDASDFQRFVYDQVLIEQLARTVAVAGKLVTPQEAETMYRLENQDVELQIAYFRATNFMASIPVEPAALGAFYTNQMANYRVGEQVQVEYVKFNATNFYAAAEKIITNIDDVVANDITRRGTNLFPGAKTAEESKKKIREAYIHQQALTEARKAASGFAQKLDAMPHTLESFHSLAQSDGFSVNTTRPFEKKYGPEELDVPQEFTAAAFSLSTDEPFGPSIAGDDGVYVMAYKARFPSHTPDLRDIQARVEEDYRFSTAMRVAEQSALSLSQSLTNGLASGQSFTSLCERAGVEPVEIPAFSLNTTNIAEDLDHGIGLNFLKQVAFSTKVAQASPAVNARDGAFIVFVVRQLPMDENKLKARLPSFIAYLRQQRANESFNLWLQSEVGKDPAFNEAVARLTTESKATKTAPRRPSS